MSDKPFVKSANTSVSASNSRGELERLLTRYGCKRLSVDQDYTNNLLRIGFVVPGSSKDSPSVPIRFDIQIRAVYDRLYGAPKVWAKRPDGTYGNITVPSAYKPDLVGKAERVAWRNIILWVDAALAAASIGVQDIEDAFLAHTLIRDQEGRTARLADHINSAATGGSWRALLAPPEDV